ncbi:porin [Terrarubrum flagellatum]|uniref:porin n=1 Tax=Terrirubrum flagellatum TaxID=2895980 RepID=UPI0031455B33
MKLFIACLALLAPAVASAQQLGERIPGQRSATGMSRDAGPARSMRPCPQYGPGFFKLEGSNTCVRLGGEARFEFGYGGGRSRDAYSGTRSGAMVELDARTETELGQLRTVVRGGGNVATGSLQDRRW